jgi:hypothetical protein
MRPLALRAAILGTAIFLGGCKTAFDPTTPYPGTLLITVASGNQQLATPGTWLSAPLRAVVVHTLTSEPVQDIAVDWRIVSGSGALLETSYCHTDPAGAAATRVRLGGTAGEYIIEARFRGSRGAPARFTVYATGS